ncbi:MAG: GtrA family protein [Bacillota bacterium]|nr:GtrA family protein [Bacillota bacterium]
MGKYKEVVSYLVFGGLTTLVNIVTYYVCVNTFGLDYKVATTIAWVLSVAFAYITNKMFVFNSRITGTLPLLKEFFSFIFFRILSYFLDLLTMIFLIEHLHSNDLLAKIIANVFVVIFNYVASKLFIFKKRKDVSAQSKSNE